MSLVLTRPKDQNQLTNQQNNLTTYSPGITKRNLISHHIFLPLNISIRRTSNINRRNDHLKRSQPKPTTQQQTWAKHLMLLEIVFTLYLWSFIKKVIEFDIIDCNSVPLFGLNSRESFNLIRRVDTVHITNYCYCKR